MYKVIAIFFLLFNCFFLARCEYKTQRKEAKIVVPPPIIQDTIKIDNLTAETDTTPVILKVCDWDTYLQQQGLVDIQTVDSSILVNLKYSTTDNFMERDMYNCLENCYLQPDVAERLKLCQEYLKKKDSTLSLLIYDGVRPRSVQQYMWDLLDMPIHEKTKFVSNPKRGSLHNFGAAVDITIADAFTGEALDMGAKFDEIDTIAYPIWEKKLLEDSLLTQQQVDNRKLLRKVMRKGKFFNIQTEWWHFNACYRDSAYVKYHIVEGMEFDNISLDNSSPSLKED